MPQRQLQNFDNLVHLDWTKEQDVKQLGDDILLGEWFIFFKQGWHIPPETSWQPEGKLGQLLSSTSNTERLQQPLILFRGNEKIQLPAVSIDPKPLPQPTLISLTCDKSLYRVQHDTVHLLIASPQTPQAELTLSLSLHGTSFADYPVKLDQYGMALQKLNDLPEGEYRAELLKTEASPCHFEVAEYRLSPLNAELVAQELSHQTLRYTLSITAFNQPYSGPVEIELTEEGNRVGARHKINCNAEGLCQGAVDFFPYSEG
jgi:hypothetical protein